MNINNVSYQSYQRPSHIFISEFSIFLGLALLMKLNTEMHSCYTTFGKGIFILKKLQDIFSIYSKTLIFSGYLILAILAVKAKR